MTTRNWTTHIDNNKIEEDPEDPSSFLHRFSPTARGTISISSMTTTKKDSLPRLIHPSLHGIPQAIRFPMAGAINTVVLMTSLYFATAAFEDKYSASTVYSVISMLCLPIGHAVSSLIVFGWPKPYLPNLLMNLPIGMSSTVVGTICTGILDNIQFDEKCTNMLQQMNLMVIKEGEEEDEDGGNLFSSVLVIIITGIWSYVLSVYVNSAPKKKHDKEL